MDKSKQRKRQKAYQAVQKGNNQISRVIILLDSNIQISTQKITRTAKKQESIYPIQRKNKPTKTIPEKDVITIY